MREGLIPNCDLDSVVDSNLQKLSENANRYSINIKQVEVQMPILIFPLLTSKALVKLKESHHAYLIFPFYKPSLLFFRKT